MKRNFLFLLLSLFSISVFSQMPQGGQGRRPGGGAGMNAGHFYGKIVDKKTSKGIDAASVQLVGSRFDTATKAMKDATLGGMLTKANGDFSLENLPVMGNFKLVITAIGYKPYEQKVSFDIKMPSGGGGGGMEQAMAAMDKDLGNIKMEEDASTLR